MSVKVTFLRTAHTRGCSPANSDMHHTLGAITSYKFYRNQTLSTLDGSAWPPLLYRSVTATESTTGSSVRSNGSQISLSNYHT